MWTYYPYLPEQRIRMLEEYKKILELEIKDLRNEISEVKNRIEELKNILNKENRSQQLPPNSFLESFSQPFTAPWGRGMGGGMGGGMGRGRGRGMGGGWGRGTGFGFQPPQKPLTLPDRFKVAISSQTNGGLNDLVSPTFARCPAFTVVDVENGKISDVKIVKNEYLNQPSGVGIAVAQMLGSMGVNVVVAGSFGPNAYMVLNQFNISIFNVPPNTKVEDAVNMLMKRG